jgi:ribosomal protein S18 acetylase RimI-like enzyme
MWLLVQFEKYLERNLRVGIWLYANHTYLSKEMLVGPKTFTFSIAATRPESRGRGIGTALTWTCLAHGRDQGYEYCYTDWISPNLAASRLWPRFGFREVAYRLTKQINPMIAWTRTK